MAELTLSDFEYPEEADEIFIVGNTLEFSVVAEGIHKDRIDLISTATKERGLSFYALEEDFRHSVIKPFISYLDPRNQSAEFIFKQTVLEESGTVFYVSGFYRDYLGQVHQIRKKLMINRSVD